MLEQFDKFCTRCVIIFYTCVIVGFLGGCFNIYVVSGNKAEVRDVKVLPKQIKIYRF